MGTRIQSIRYRLLKAFKGLAQTEKTRQAIDAEGRRARLLLGKMLANQVRAHGIYEDIQDAEFQVFSQFGDDGILQYLIAQTGLVVDKFIEFGVENYTEANTRFLLMNNNWSGLVIDGNPANIEFIRGSSEFWRYDLEAVPCFISRDNINGIFEDAGFTGEIGLLSVDIDGNDYWVWEAIQIVDPVIVVVEYNSVFGPKHAVTVPYDPAFYRTNSHWSNLYWGASLGALCYLAEKKGYVFVGCNSAGNNAHFVRKDRAGKIPVKTSGQGFVESKFRESRNVNGKLSYLRGKQRLEVIMNMKVVDVITGSTIRIKDLIV